MFQSKSYHTVLNLLCFRIWLIRASSGDSTCYYPNGNIAPTYQPCNSTDGGKASLCCELSTSVCTTKGLCFGSDAYPYRGGCTDPSWKSESCPTFCANVAKNTFSTIVPCNPGTVGREFCCYTPGSTGSCCDQKFDLWPDGVPNGAGMPFAPQINDNDITQSSSSAQVPIGVNTASSSLPATSLVNTASPSPPATSLASTPKGSSNNATKVGVGVGVPLGVLLLLLLGFLLFRERKNRVHTQELIKEALTTAEETQGRKEQYPGPAQELKWGWSGLSELHSKHVPKEQHPKPPQELEWGRSGLSELHSEHVP